LFVGVELALPKKSQPLKINDRGTNTEFDEKELYEIRKYIELNPLNWNDDEYNK
jgi:hypothetical protein